MSDLGSTRGVEGVLRRLEDKFKRMESQLAKGRIPRTCTSALRPNPARIQPGVRVFETDTNRSIFVNATQSGWVNASGQSV